MTQLCSSFPKSSEVFYTVGVRLWYLQQHFEQMCMAAGEMGTKPLSWSVTPGSRAHHKRLREIKAD